MRRQAGGQAGTWSTPRTGSQERLGSEEGIEKALVEKHGQVLRVGTALALR